MQFINTNNQYNYIKFVIFIIIKLLASFNFKYFYSSKSKKLTYFKITLNFNSEPNKTRQFINI